MTSSDRPGRSPQSSAPRPRGQARSAARLAAVQALYQMDLAGTGAEAVLREFLNYRLDPKRSDATLAAADRGLFADLVRGVAARREELDRMLTATLTADWPLERLDAVLRAILRAAVYELIGRADVPPRVVINEYLELAHDFFSGGEPALVNGVLDRIAHVVRADELQAGSRDRPAPSA